MNGYTKLFGSIVASTIWREDDKTRIVWITMLALANQSGIVEASIPGLADLARVTIEDVKVALQKLQSPDPYSRTKDHEGRRIQPVDGGWLLVNHAKYRAHMSKEDHRNYQRAYRQQYRAEGRDRSRSTLVNTGQQLSTRSIQAEAEAEQNRTEQSTDVGQNVTSHDKASRKRAAAAAPASDSEWLKELAADQAYQGIDVPREHAKMVRWCQTNRQQPTRKRFVNWLNRIEKPLGQVTKPTPSNNPQQEDIQRMLLEAMQ